MTAPKRSNDHKAWLAYWSDEVLRTIRRASTAAPSVVDFEMLYLDRATRIMHHRAVKAHPRLKPEHNNA